MSVRLAAAVAAALAFLAAPAPALAALSLSYPEPVADITGSGLAVADFDGDDALDVAGVLGDVGVVFGDGTGGFSDPVFHSTGGDEAFSITTGDFDRDGAPDLAVSSHALETVSVLLNDGTGDFDAPVDHAIDGPPGEVIAADLVGDGADDLAVTTTDAVHVLLADGAGDFSPADSYATATGAESLAAGDFDGDGLLDLAVAVQADPNPLVDVRIAQSVGGKPTYATSTEIQLDAVPFDVTSADFDGDGDADLAVDEQDALSIHVSDGSGGFAQSDRWLTGFSAWDSLAAADFDHDGIADIAFNSGQSVGLFRAVGDGTVVRWGWSQAAPGHSPTATFAVGDFNDDGEPDVVTAEQSRLNLLAGDPVTTTPARLEFGSVRLGSPPAVQTVTVLNSGVADLALGSAAITGAGAAGFELADDDCSGDVLASFEECEIDVRLRTTTADHFLADLTLDSDAAAAPRSVTLQGSVAGPQAPELLASPLDFGDLHPGQSKQLTFGARNNGLFPIDLGPTAIQGSGAAAYSVVADGCAGVTLDHSDFCSVTVRFAPPSGGAFHADVSIPSQASPEPIRTWLYGRGIGPGLELGPTAVEFGTARITATTRSMPVTVRNTGTVPLAGVTLSVTGADAGAFKLNGAACAQTTLNPGDRCRASVAFAPTKLGPHTALLTAAVAGVQDTSPLSGTGSLGPIPGGGPNPPAGDGTRARLRAGLRAAVARWQKLGTRGGAARGFTTTRIEAPRGARLSLQLRLRERRLAYGQTKVGDGPVTVRAKPTPWGRRLLRSARVLRLNARLVLTPRFEVPVEASRRFVVRRR